MIDRSGSDHRPPAPHEISLSGDTARFRSSAGGSLSTDNLRFVTVLRLYLPSVPAADLKS